MKVATVSMDNHQDQSPIEIIEQLRAQNPDKRVISLDQIAGRGHILLDGKLAMEILNDPKLHRPQILRRMVGEGLPWTSGEEWKDARKNIRPGLTKKAFDDCLPEISQSIDALLDQMRDAARNGTSLALVPLIAATLLRISSRSIFGIDIGIDTDHAMTLMKMASTSNRLTGIWIFDPSGRIDPAIMEDLRECKKDVYEISGKILDMAKTGSFCPSRAMKCMIDWQKGDDSVTDQRIIEHTSSLLLASVETTSSMISNTFQFLSEKPEWLSGIRDEFRSFEEWPPRNIKEVEKLTIATACCRESIRMRPPIWLVARTAPEPMVIDGKVKVDRGDQIYTCLYLIHRNQEVWDDPDDFQPERFLERGQLEGDEYLPFGLGRHYCLGAPLALTEGAMIIGKCCSEFLMSFEDEAEDAPRDGFLMGPPLTLRFHPSEIGADRVDRGDEKHNKDGNGQT
jgi:cytochrome P450